MNQDASCSDEIMRSFQRFVSESCGIELYDYQLQPARAILDSFRMGLGLTIVLDFPIMSGKDELLSQLEVYFMAIINDKDHNIVVVNPNDSDNLTAVMRLGNQLISNILTNGYWKMIGMDFILGKVRTIFYSMEAMIVGKPFPASLFLIVNEAEKIHPDDYDHINAILTEGRNLTRIICGSDNDNDSLLSREIKRAIRYEKKDGIKRLFKVTEAQARQENKALDFKISHLGELYEEREDEIKSMYLGE